MHYSSAAENNKLRRDLREFEEYASMPFYRKIPEYFSGIFHDALPG
jgi:hypothetical protein